MESDRYITLPNLAGFQSRRGQNESGGPCCWVDPDLERPGRPNVSSVVPPLRPHQADPGLGPNARFRAREPCRRLQVGRAESFFSSPSSFNPPAEPSRLHRPHREGRFPRPACPFIRPGGPVSLQPSTLAAVGLGPGPGVGPPETTFCSTPASPSRYPPRYCAANRLKEAAKRGLARTSWQEVTLRGPGRVIDGNVARRIPRWPSPSNQTSRRGTECLCGW